MLRIAEAREARGYTQEQLAQAIGTTQQTIQRWESGQVTPRVDKVEDVSRALGITMSFSPRLHHFEQSLLQVIADYFGDAE